MVIIHRVMGMDHRMQEAPTNTGKAKQRVVGKREINCARCVLSITIGAVPRSKSNLFF